MADGTRDWHAVRSMAVSVPAHVVFRDLSQETVLLNVQTGQYHGIDGIGGRFFDVMRASADLDAAAKVLSSEFGQPAEVIEQDLTAFVGEMVASGLVELAPARR